MPNSTLAYVSARHPFTTICFSGAVTTVSVHLNGPGGQSGNGFPLPRRGRVTGLHLWDGTTYRSDSTEVEFQAGDKIAIYCQYSGSTFGVKVRINGSSTASQVIGVPANVTLFVTVEIMLVRE